MGIDVIIEPHLSAEEPVAMLRLAARWKPYVHDVLDPEEAKLLIARQGAFVRTHLRTAPDVEGVPEDIMRKLVDHGVSASPASEIDREIERLGEFRRAVVPKSC